MKNKKLKKIGTLAIGTTLAVSCVLSPVAAAEEAASEPETSAAVSVQQNETDEAVLNELLQNEFELPIKPDAEQKSDDAALQTEDVDKSELSMAIEYSEQILSYLQEEWVTPPGAYQSFVDAVAQAKAVLNDSNATQDDVDETILKLDEVLNNMELTEKGIAGVIKAVVNQSDAEISKYKDVFSAESWQAYEDAKLELEQLIDSSDFAEEDLEEAYFSFLDAMLSLEAADDLDKKAEVLLEQAKAAIAAPEKYTEDSLAAVEDAVFVLETAMADDDMDLAFAYVELKDAMDHLVFVSDETTTEKPTEQETTTQEQTTQETTTQKPAEKPSTGNSDNPKTGDDRNLLPFGLTASTSAAVMGVTMLLKKKKTDETV